MANPNFKAIVISSYTPAGTSKGTKMRKSEKQTSASLRGKAKGRKVATEKSTASKVAKAIKNVTKTKQVYDPSAKHLPTLR